MNGSLPSTMAASPLILSTLSDAGIFSPDDLFTAIPMLLQDASIAEAFLIGNADDGQIWGKWHGSKLYFAHDIGIGAPLRSVTLSWLRICAASCEFRLYPRKGRMEIIRAEEKRPASQNADRKLQWTIANVDQDFQWMTVDREYPLIGAHLSPNKPPQQRTSSDGAVTFTILRGRASEIHAPPLRWQGERKTYPRLIARHYYQRKKFDIWSLVDTRWIELTIHPKIADVKDDRS